MPNDNDARIIGFKAGYKDPVTGEFKRDLFWERLGAESGDPEAMIQMGVAYLHGDGVERDPVKACEYFLKVAEMDEPVGQYNMGVQCAKGEGVKRDFAAAIDWMEQARDNGDEDAVKTLETLKDAPEIERKAYAGDAEAQALFSTLLGNFSSEANIRESFEMAKRSVEQGCPRGYYALGSRYMYGVGVEKDEVKGAALYKKGAELGSPECQVRYAGCLREGEGVPQDYNGFVEWAAKAAAQGYAKAAVGLSMESKDGNLPVPTEKLIEFLLKAAEKEPGNAEVAQHLGIQYINLEPSDFEQSIYWYDRAGELGDEMGKAMASIYRYRQKLIDNGTLPDGIGAVDYMLFLQRNDLIAEASGREPEKKEPDYDIDDLLEAVEAGNPDAVKAYAFACFTEGEEVYEHGIDKARSMALLEKLSDTDAQAAGIIGMFYMNGTGVQKNDELAEKWLSKAVEGGETDLEDMLESVRAEIGPMPDYECKLTNTKKGDRKERSELVKVGDTITLAMSDDGSRIDFLTRAGDVGDVSSDSWLKELLAEQIPYQAEVITSVPYSKLESKRMNPVIEVRLHIDATKQEMKKRLGWDYVPTEIYGSGKYLF